MKIKHNIWTKLKVCWFWLFHYGDAVTVSCGYCGSTNLGIVEKKTVLNKYFSKYRCNKCGAIATNEEVWSKS